MIEFASMKKNLVVSIIFVYYNTPREIINALESIKKALGNYYYEVIVIDNCSLKPLPKEISDFGIKVIKNKVNEGYGKALNQGVKAAKGEYLVFSNSDVVFLPNSIAAMVDVLENNKFIGAIGPQLLDNKKKIQMVGSGMPFLPQALFVFSFLNKVFPANRFSKNYYLSNFDRKTEKEIPVLCGACFLMKRQIFDEIKGFDERFFMYFEEADICYRIKKQGYGVLYYPLAKVIHLIGKSSSDKSLIQKRFEESRYKFFKKYQNFIAAVIGELFLRIFGFVGALI